MNWSTHEFIWLDWVILILGILSVAFAVWYSIKKDKEKMKGTWEGVIYEAYEEESDFTQPY